MIFNDFKINPIPDVCVLIQFATTEQCKLHVEFKIMLTWRFTFLKNHSGSLL